MRQTMLALAFLAAGGYLEAKQIAVYGRDGKTADVLAKTLKTAENTEFQPILTFLKNYIDNAPDFFYNSFAL